MKGGLRSNHTAYDRANYGILLDPKKYRGAAERFEMDTLNDHFAFLKIILAAV